MYDDLLYIYEQTNKTYVYTATQCLKCHECCGSITEVNPNPNTPPPYIYIKRTDSVIAYML